MVDSINVIGPGWRATTPTGQIIKDAVLEFYDADTNGALTVYSDYGLSVSLGPSVACDSGGYPITSGNAKTLIYTGSAAYRMRLVSTGSGSVWDHDDIKGALDTSNFVNSETDISLVMASVADMVLLNVNAGQRITTTSYYSGWGATSRGPSGGAEYVVVLKPTHDVVRGVSTVDEYGDHTLANGNVALLISHDNVIDITQFGSRADGTDCSAQLAAAVTRFLATSASFGEQYPDSDQPSLYFPAGHYNAAATPITITTSNTGQVIFGDGIASQLEGILILIDDNRCQVRDVLLRGAGAFGIRCDGSTNSLRGAIVQNVWIRDRTDGIRILGSSNANLLFTDVYCEKNTHGLRVDDTLGSQFVNCQFISNTEYGIYAIKAGELKFTNCNASGNENYGIYLVGGTGSQVVECYFHQVSCANNQTNIANRDTNAITAAASNGAGGTRLTIGAHTLTEGMQGIVITGTTDYNGTFDVFNVTATTVDIAVTFTSNQTGTLTRPEWDMFLQSNTAVGNINDMFFVGCNINFIRMSRVYNATFVGTRIKEQIWLENSCNRIMRVSTGRGRQTNSFRNIQFSGQNTGFMEIISSDATASSAATGTESLALRVPNSTKALVGNLATYNAIHLDETIGVQVTGAVYSGASLSVATDTAISFTPPQTSGRLDFTNGAGQTARMAQIGFNTVTPSTSSIYLGAIMAITTGALTGTTGGAGVITISAHTDGKIYVENRTGATHNLYWTIYR